MNNKLIELAEKEILRKNILEILEECGDEGASEELISKCVSRAGIKCDTESIKKECEYLKGKGLVNINHVDNKVLGIKRNIMTITSAGVDILDGTNAVEGVGG